MTLQFREATEADLASVVRLLRDDFLGQSRETPDLAPYVAAFRDMQREAGNILIVGEMDGDVVAVYQLVIMSGLSLGATRRAQIEGVRVAAQRRGQGIGALLMADAETRARVAGARLMQFTTNKQRPEAHRFYARCGYVATHEGFKKPLA